MWANIITKLRESKLANKPTIESDYCIHGEKNCGRCATSELDTTIKTYTRWESLEGSDLRRVVNTISKSVLDFMRAEQEKLVVAGGFIRAIISNESINDLDLFVPTESKATNLFTGTRGEMCIDTTIEKQLVQIIWRYPFVDPQEILDQFDFTVCKAAIWFSNGTKDDSRPGFKSICHPRFYKDMARKVLVYKREVGEERLMSIPRLLKYASYGYTIEPESLAKVIVDTCMSLNPLHGYEGVIKGLEDCFKNSDNKEWKKLNEKYQEPRRDYSYGS